MLRDYLLLRLNATGQGRQTCGATKLKIPPDSMRGTDLENTATLFAVSCSRLLCIYIRTVFIHIDRSRPSYVEGELIKSKYGL